MNLLPITFARAAVCIMIGGAIGVAADMQSPGRLELDRGVHEQVLPTGLADNRSTSRVTSRTTWRTTWRSRDGAVLDVPAADVVAWGRCPPWPVGPHVLLADGGVIAGTLEAFDGTTAVVRSAALGRLSLPANICAGFRRTAASQPAAAALEQGRAAAADPAADCFMRLRNGDHLAARGVTIRDGCAEIDWQGGRNAIPLDRIQSLTWAAVVAQDAPSLPTLRLALDDGSRFSLTSLGPSEPALTVDPALVVAVAGEGAAATSLAMLAPIAFEHSSTAGPTRPLARGQTLTGDWPAARGITGFTGLGIHAPARVRYRLDRPADRFESTVAIDDSAGRDGSVVVRIVAIDDRAERREVYVSPVLRGDEEPLVIRAELAGARELELVVEPAGRDDRLDRTIWLDPRVITIE